MKQLFFILFLLASLPNTGLSQVEEGAFDALKIEVDNLKILNETLRKRQYETDYNRFKDLENTVKSAFDKTDVISTAANYQTTIKSIIILHNEITHVNNFTDAESVFGLDFEEKILQIATTTLVNNIQKINNGEPDISLTQRKSNFKTIISNIVKNPIVNSIVKSNPITSVAHTIINQMLSARATKITDITISRDDFPMPDKFKDFKSKYHQFKKSYETIKLEGGLPETKQLINQASIDIFTSELKPMVKLFDDLSSINEEFESSLEVFLEASEQTIIRAKPIESRFYALLNAQNRNEARTKIDGFFNTGPSPVSDVLTLKLSDNGMREVEKYSKEVNEVYILLKNDFLKILSLEIKLANAYLDYFIKLKGAEPGYPTFDSMDALDDKISKFTTLRTNLETQKQDLTR